MFQLRSTLCCVAAVPVPVILSTAGEFDALLGNDNVAEVAPLDCGVNVTVKFADWPAGIVIGSAIPESANSPFESLGGWTVTDAPLAIRLALSAELVPTTTLPKLRLTGDTANVPDAVPVPESAIVSGEFDAFDTTDKLPLAAPALAGVKVAVNVMLPPGVSVIGNPLNPLMENPAPLKFACEMETDDPPTLVSVSDKFTLLLTCTLPNARLVGFAVSIPCVTPVPESAMLKLESEPLEVMVALPLAAPPAVGEKSALKDVLWPAAKVKGNASPLRLNPVPPAAAAEMVRLDGPVLLRATDCVWLPPTSTFPKLTLLGLEVS